METKSKLLQISFSYLFSQKPNSWKKTLELNNLNHFASEDVEEELVENSRLVLRLRRCFILYLWNQIQWRKRMSRTKLTYMSIEFERNLTDSDWRAEQERLKGRFRRWDLEEVKRRGAEKMVGGWRRASGFIFTSTRTTTEKLHLILNEYPIFVIVNHFHNISKAKMQFFWYYIWTE